MSHVDPNQKIFLSAEYLFDVKSFSEFDILFNLLPSIPEGERATGRPKTSPLSLLKCFIYRSTSGIDNLSELKRALSDNPSLYLKRRLDLLNLPPVERFSSFLKSAPSTFFWGYKNHILSDATSELSLFEVAKPANVSEGKLLIPMIRELKEHTEILPQAVIGDGAYDHESNPKFVIQKLKTKPLIARHLHWEKNKNYILSKKENTHLESRIRNDLLGMLHDRGRVRLKYVCPITHLKNYRKKYFFCPWNYSKFTQGKGCYVYLRTDDTARDSIEYGSTEFKRLYNFGTASERIID